MFRLLVWTVKLVLGVAQFAFLSRIAERTGLRATWVHPVAAMLSRPTGVDTGVLEVLLVAAVSLWLVWVFSALCECFTAALERHALAGFEGPRSRTGDSIRSPR
jgi:hypothetical protein